VARSDMLSSCAEWRCVRFVGESTICKYRGKDKMSIREGAVVLSLALFSIHHVRGLALSDGNLAADQRDVSDVDRSRALS